MRSAKAFVPVCSCFLTRFNEGMALEFHDVGPSRAARVAARIVVTAYISATALMIAFEPAGDWETITDRGIYFWSVRLIWLLMWFSAGYLLHLAGVSLRAGEFPGKSAVVLVRTKKKRGVRALVASILLILAAMPLIAAPIFWQWGLEHMKQDLERTDELSSRAMQLF